MKIYQYVFDPTQNICKRGEFDIYNNGMTSMFELKNPERAAEIARDSYVDVEYNGDNDDVIPDNEKVIKELPLYILFKSDNSVVPIDMVFTIDKDVEINEDLNTYVKLTESQLLNHAFFKKCPFKWIKRKY